MEIRVVPSGIGIAYDAVDENGDPVGLPRLSVSEAIPTNAGPLRVATVTIAVTNERQWELLREAVNDPAGFARRNQARSSLIVPPGRSHPLDG